MMTTDETITVTIQRRKTPPEMDNREMAAHLKAVGHTSQTAWSQFVIMRGLKPDIDAKKFYAIFGEVSPQLGVEVSQRVIHPDFYDHLMGCKLEIIRDENTGVFRMVWESGMTGSNPPVYPPLPDRYQPVTERGKESMASWIHLHLSYVGMDVPVDVILGWNRDDSTEVAIWSRAALTREVLHNEIDPPVMPACLIPYQSDIPNTKR